MCRVSTRTENLRQEARILQYQKDCPRGPNSRQISSLSSSCVFAWSSQLSSAAAWMLRRLGDLFGRLFFGHEACCPLTLKGLCCDQPWKAWRWGGAGWRKYNDADQNAFPGRAGDSDRGSRVFSQKCGRRHRPSMGGFARKATKKYCRMQLTSISFAEHCLML